MKAVIRLVTIRDFAAVGKVMIDCYSALAVQEGYTRLELEGLVHSCSPSAIMKRCGSFRVYVAEVEGEVAGAVAIEEQEITELFVSPDWQGQGIGRNLLAEAEREIAASGSNSVFVWTATAPAFYQRHAYHTVETATCSGGPLQGRSTTRLTKRLYT
jgi:N-acetylglutamate synthase-like GNAT family acetyltransferase